jgi:KipI family sensor histidine kinase inhibitor
MPFEYVSDSALIIRLGDSPSPEVTTRIIGLMERLRPFFKNFHPAYCSLLIDFDPLTFSPNTFKADIADAPVEGRVKKVPVQYDGEDLSEVARVTGLSTEEVIRLHSSAEYTVAFLGFAPGFPYLLGLPRELRCPRKKSPRVRVPAGSVAVAGEQSGIYPVASPGGWQLIGRTDLRLFDPAETSPSYLEPGDRVRFVLAAKTAARAVSAAAPMSSVAAVEIEHGGLYSTVQDLGRDGWTHLGVSPGGAADSVALRLGNRLVGNSENAAALEMTLQGATVRILRDTWLAVSSGAAELDGQAIANWTSIPACAGQRLVIGAIPGRSYLCIHGGIGVDEKLGSRSTHASGWGGFAGRTVRAGDLLPVGEQSSQTPVFRRCDPRALYGETPLRVTRGPQANWFTSASLAKFFAGEFVVTEDANRLGLRLKGPSLDYGHSFKGHELVTEGIANGAIQVPAGGDPMILFCEQRTTGGYPKIANVARADLYRLGQLMPGQKVRFVEITVEEGWRLNRELESTLQNAVHEF